MAESGRERSLERRKGFDIQRITRDGDDLAANVGYILYLVGLFTAIPTLVAVIVAYVARGASPEWLRTHHTFLIRTFWIHLAGTVVGVLLIWILIGWIILPIVWIWAFVRMVKGLLLLNRQQAIPRPESWGLG